MVNGGVFGGILGFIGTATTGFIVAGLWIWRHRTNLDTEDHERISELRDDQRSVFDDKLANLFLDIEDAVEDANPPEEVERSEMVITAVHRVVDEDDVKDVVEELEKIGERRDIYERHEDRFEKCYKSLFKIAAAMILVGIIFTYGTAVQSEPFNPMYIIIYTALIGYIGSEAMSAYTDFQSANSLKDQFEKEWRDYKSPE